MVTSRCSGPPFIYILFFHFLLFVMLFLFLFLFYVSFFLYFLFVVLFFCVCFLLVVCVFFFRNIYCQGRSGTPQAQHHPGGGQTKNQFFGGPPGAFFPGPRVRKELHKQEKTRTSKNNKKTTCRKTQS